MRTNQSTGGAFLAIWEGGGKVGYTARACMLCDGIDQ